MLESLKSSTGAGRPSSKSRVVDRDATTDYFKTTVDPILEEMLRSLAVAQPDDPKEFLVELLTTHKDLENTIMKYEPAVKAGTVRTGMTVSSKRVLAELVLAEDGSAKFTVFNPMVSKSAMLSVPADNAVLKELAAEYGSMTLYHCETHLSIVEAEGSTDFRLEWE